MSTKEWLVLIILGFLVEVSTTADPIQILNSSIAVASEGDPWQDMTSDNVNDGIVDYRRTVEKCGCCAALRRPSWVQLTLDKTYLVEKIQIFGRKYDTSFQQFHDIKLSLGRQDQTLKNEAFTTKNQSFAMTILTPPREVDTVRVSDVTQQFDYMTICEIMIYRQADCTPGKYSANCSKECHCLSGPCESVTGNCVTATCKDGWRGLACNETCNPGTFGSNCTNICNCVSNLTCNHYDGGCPNNKCAAGWTHANCSVACNPSTFGSNCSNICICHNNATCYHVDGSCTNNQCAAGWTHDNCSVACKAGFYGQGCSMDCHCDTCHHVNGSCFGSIQCHDGFRMENGFCTNMLEELVLTENRLLTRTTTWPESQRILITMTAFKCQTRRTTLL
ncbi:hypothetical protein DPMN_159889 [Dreissena polymorpha]|uniref:Uncharacterized protein n=1 Tax=Dreissena polymorpha TaxID=45954 RepID=A0A9D4EMG5_DREPO|nr:hypothetical protein DPMN_159889 [Dreissena polymorpha]